MGLTQVTATIRSLRDPERTYSALFLVDTGAYDSVIPEEAAEALGVEPIGAVECELADGTPRKFPFAICQIEFMGEVTGGRVLFGPPGTEPLLGVTALESVGIAVDPRTQGLKRLPAIPLKRAFREPTAEIRA
jgi:clan AA aspartic protease